MDKVNSTKLTALISRLTVAANKAVKKTNSQQDTRKHYAKSDFRNTLRLHLNEQNFHAAKLIK